MKHFYLKALMAGAIAIASMTQAQAADVTYFEDGFDWLTGTTTVVQGWDTQGESNWRFDKWESLNNPGWLSFTGWVWARPGFPKLSKTGYNGDFVSPAFAKIDGTKTVDVAFQAVGYTSAKFKKDGNLLYVIVLGAGKATKVIGTGATIAPVNYVDPATGDLSSLIEYKNSVAIELDTTKAFMDPNETTALEVWKANETKFTVTIEGATKDTRVAFLAGGKLQTAKLKSDDPVYLDRVFLDNIKVTSNNSAVSDVNAAKQVASVAYYNLAGQQSAEPFEGISVKRIAYTDGSVETQKVIK